MASAKPKHPTPPTTGKHLDLLQDECRELSVWLASRGNARQLVIATVPSADWRDIKGYYPWPAGVYPAYCCVCGSTHEIGMESRFNYPVCEQHSKLPPYEISQQRTDGK